MWSLLGQAANFVLRIASMVIVARLVTPEHFGLVGMVTAFTGVLGLFRDAGLPQATIQQERLTPDDLSTLFWINLAVGTALAIIACIGAPALASFYSEPRLLWITIAISSAFFFSGASAQHKAILQREMRFGALMVVELAGLVVSIVAGVLAAFAGWGYWALVVMAVSLPAAVLVGTLLVTRWLPGRPRRGAGVERMVRYGGMITLNSVVVYLAYNVDKVLLGRFWGAEALGTYGRAYQLVSLPTDNLNSTINWVMFPVISRLQNDLPRQRAYFLMGYELFLWVAMPVTLACALFSADIVRVLLGTQWDSAIPLFTALAPTVLAFALFNPFGTLMQASGHA
ncbi:MAG: lipopolysaccharide biosynthesis protein, partial [Burkholderiales bacterium]|nr:lipopolysaccharide biosynthesis protein [Burkholderiales bacterium]